MELFYSRHIENDIVRLDKDESAHCIKVLRHRCSDEIHVINGEGVLYKCQITSDTPKAVEARIIESHNGWGNHPYHLHLGVCPTKSNDRYEWFIEKACELGFDELSPIIGDHSERKVFKSSRAEKILISASKQSLKAAIPVVHEPISAKEFIRKYGKCQEGGDEDKVLRLIAYCFEDEAAPRKGIRQMLEEFQGNEIIVMIGPEGDFSKEEAEYALKCGFVAVHLGNSRLRTETAALTAAAATYFRYI